MSASLADSRAPATMAFDRLAAEYDTLVSGEIFQALRRRTHAAFARHFGAGSTVLEIGCGTGHDTAFLAARGVRVVACDPSEEMVSRALRRLAREGVECLATVLPCGLQEVAAYLDALAGADQAAAEAPGPVPSSFDGIVSNFGALNCVKDLRPLGAVAARYLKPGGVVVIGLMGRTCVFEALYFAALRRPGVWRRRAAGPVAVPVAGVDVPTYYHRLADVRAALGAPLALAAIEGIGVAIPPPYLEPRWQSVPKPLRGLATRIDAVVSRWPPFNRAGDHVLMHFVKAGPAHA